ncbi:DUF2982 domain-containing protein [Lacimicrobium alkaliphilum]|uniref:DUF2982 domain-containing protein n=1 Tax=Lacimicrobium alkaliphilum TaxID=1526571 RepID=A0ABQ1R7A9_9ALTE|nr:DUF2982 domain-containing protein [Lacimicrobium alkaliphilum]GGD61050.1 hypothetical protein GCM10011357_15430 [Lacimicrobium alkaliphilum]
MTDIIRIRAGAKRNGFTLCLAGTVALLLSAMWLAWMPELLRLAGIFLTSASLVTILIGWLKIREPAYSFELTPEKFRYLHRFGGYSLDWDNIQRIDIPRLHTGLTHEPMELVGIRLKSYDPLLEDISPRLASNILMQQRPLLLQAHRQNCTSGGCYSDTLIEDDSYKSAQGKQYLGMLAMLANRMGRMREAFGYDLYLYSSELDREEQEFVALLKACQQQAIQQ